MSIQRNLLANSLAQGWTALMGLAFVPWYVKLLGMEAYGLIGFYILLQSWLVLLDLGMGLTLNREMSRFQAGAHQLQGIHDLLRSALLLCLAVATVTGAIMVLAAPWLADTWLRASALPAPVVSDAVALMGLVLGLRLLESVLHGAILGLQAQVGLAMVTCVLATLRWGGAVAVLLWAGPSLHAYFVWHAAVSAGAVLALGLMLRSLLPRPPAPPRASWAALRELRGFAGGLVATSLLALLLTQVDKILLSRLAPLEVFGYFSLANVLAGALQQLVAPVSQAFYPKFTELVTLGDTRGLAQAYHLGTQLVCVVIGPAALLAAMFAEPLLLLWTGNPMVAQQVAPLLALLAVGNFINAVMHLPHTLQLAHGWLALGVKLNVVAVLVLVPLLFVVVPRYGALGAAWLWVALNVCYLTIGVQLMHRKVLPGEELAWYFGDFARPVAAAMAVMLVGRALHPSGLGSVAEASWLAVVAAAGVAAAAGVLPAMRHGLRAWARTAATWMIRP